MMMKMKKKKYDQTFNDNEKVSFLIKFHSMLQSILIKIIKPHIPNTHRPSIKTTLQTI